MAITLLTLHEAAERYQLPLQQLRRLVRTGTIAVVTVNGHTFVDDEEVRKVAGDNGNHVHWIALKDAARQYSLDEALLERLAKEEFIRSGVLGEELHLAVEDAQPIAARLSKANFRNLEGRPIELTRAARQYRLPERSLLTWAKRGYISHSGRAEVQWR